MITIEALLVDALNFIKRYFNTYFAAIFKKPRIIKSVTRSKSAAKYMNPHLFFILSISFIGVVSGALFSPKDYLNIEQIYIKDFTLEAGRSIISMLPLVLLTYAVLWIASIKIDNRSLFISLTLYNAGVWYLAFSLLGTIFRIILLFGFGKSWDEPMKYFFFAELVLVPLFSILGVPRNLLKRRFLTIPIVLSISLLLSHKIDILLYQYKTRNNVNQDILDFNTFGTDQLQINTKQVSDSIECSIKVIVRNLSNETYLLGSIKEVSLYFREHDKRSYYCVIRFKPTAQFDKTTIVYPHEMTVITFERSLSKGMYQEFVSKIKNHSATKFMPLTFPPGYSYLNIEYINNEFLTPVCCFVQTFSAVEIVPTRL
jgi:hypothetical protein